MNENKEDIPTELFADTFVAWVFDAWNTDPSISVALAVERSLNKAVSDQGVKRIHDSVPGRSGTGDHALDRRRILQDAQGSHDRLFG